MSDVRLLPCPFCGFSDLDDRGDNAIFCKNIRCEAGIDIGHSVGATARADRTARWNRRAADKTIIELADALGTAARRIDHLASLTPDAERKARAWAEEARSALQYRSAETDK